jgi:hypothetical protein
MEPAFVGTLPADGDASSTFQSTSTTGLSSAQSDDEGSGDSQMTHDDEGSTSHASTSSESTQESSSSTTSESSTPTQMYRLRVDNGESGGQIGTDSALMVRVDHAAMVAAGADPTGADLWLMYTRDNGQRIKMARALDFDSAWNRPDTKIWFLAAGVVDEGRGDEEHFTLEIGSENGPSVDEPDRVFFFWDDFEQSEASAEKWRFDGSDGASFEVGDGSLFLHIANANTAAYAHLFAESGHRGVDPRLEVRSRKSIQGDLLDCRYAVPAGFAIEENSRLSEAIYAGERAIYAYGDNGLLGGRTRLNNGIADNAIHDYFLLFRGLLVDFGQDAVALENHVRAMDPAETIVFPYFGLEMPGACTSGDPMELEVMWIRVRQGFVRDPVVEILP